MLAPHLFVTWDISNGILVQLQVECECMPQPQCKHLLKDLAKFSDTARNRYSNQPRPSAYEGAADFVHTDPGINKLLACSCLQDSCCRNKNRLEIMPLHVAAH